MKIKIINIQGPIRLRKEGNESYIRSENAFLQAEVDNLYRHIHKMNLYTARLKKILPLRRYMSNSFKYAEKQDCTIIPAQVDKRY